MPAGSYRARADLSPVFVISGQDFVPEITIDSADFVAEDPTGVPIVDQEVRLEAVVSNNGLLDRTLKAVLSYENVSGNVTRGRAFHILAGDTEQVDFRFLAPRVQQSATILQIVDPLRNDLVMAEISQMLDVDAYDFGISDFAIQGADYPFDLGTSFPVITNAAPVVISGKVDNLSRKTGSVAYRFEIDGSVVDEGLLHDIPPGGSADVYYVAEPPELEGSVAYLHTWLHLVSHYDGFPGAAMYDVDPVNSIAFEFAQVRDGMSCRIRPVNLDCRSDPGDWWCVQRSYAQDTSNVVDVKLQNPGLASTSSPLVTIEDSYVKWDTVDDPEPEVVTETLFQEYVLLPSWVDVFREFTWRPMQTGPHKLTFRCGEDTFEKDVFVNPHLLVVSAPEPVVADSASTTSIGDPDNVEQEKSTSSVGGLVESEEGVLQVAELYSRISCRTILVDPFVPYCGIDAELDATITREIFIDDGTDAPNLYTADLLMEAVITGVFDEIEYASAHTSYSAVVKVRVDDGSNQPLSLCSTGQLPCESPVFVRPTGTPLWETMLEEAAFELSYKIPGAGPLIEIAVFLTQLLDECSDQVRIRADFDSSLTTFFVPGGLAAVSIDLSDVGSACTEGLPQGERKIALGHVYLDVKSVQFQPDGGP